MASKARCKTKGELEDMTVKQLKYFAARKHIELNPSFRKSEIIHEISLQCRRSRASRSYAKPKYTRSRGSGTTGARGPAKSAPVCTAMYTRQGRPYKRQCEAMEDGDDEISESLCASHQLPKTRSAVMEASGVGYGVDFAEKQEMRAQLETVGEQIRIDTLVPKKSGSTAWVRHKTFAFNRNCVSSPYEPGGVIAADTQTSVLMQLCAAGDCAKRLLFAESLPTQDDQETWKRRVRQYNSYGYPRHQLQLEASWMCDSGNISIDGVRSGGITGFSIALIPDGKVFKPLRDFMLDATDPATWKNVLLTACNWVRKRVAPYGLMEDRYVRSGVPELLKMLMADGRFPNTISPESFGVLVDSQTGAFTPVILPCMDELALLRDRSLAESFVKLNTIIVYNSVAVGVMRDGAPADYQPSRSFLVKVIGGRLNTVVDFVIGQMGKVVTPTMQVVDVITKAPLVFGISISDATSMMYKLAAASFEAWVPSVRKMITGLMNWPYATSISFLLISPLLSSANAYIYIAAIKMVLYILSEIVGGNGLGDLKAGANIAQMIATMPLILQFITSQLLSMYKLSADDLKDVKEVFEISNKVQYDYLLSKVSTINVARLENILLDELTVWTEKNLALSPSAKANFECYYDSQHPNAQHSNCIADAIINQAMSPIPGAIDRGIDMSKVWGPVSMFNEKVKAIKAAIKDAEASNLQALIDAKEKIYEWNPELDPSSYQYQKNLEDNIGRARVEKVKAMSINEKISEYLSGVANVLMQNPGMTLGVAFAIVTAIITSKTVYDYRSDARLRGELEAALDERLKIVQQQARQ